VRKCEEARKNPSCLLPLITFEMTGLNRQYAEMMNLQLQVLVIYFEVIIRSIYYKSFLMEELKEGGKIKPKKPQTPAFKIIPNNRILSQ